MGVSRPFHFCLVDRCWVSTCGFPLSYPIYFLQALASIATNELELPALLCGFGGKRETVDFIAQAVASIDFELPALSCGFGSERKVNAKNLRNRDFVFNAPSPRPRLLPLMHCH